MSREGKIKVVSTETFLETLDALESTIQTTNHLAILVRTASERLKEGENPHRVAAILAGAAQSSDEYVSRSRDRVERMRELVREDSAISSG